MQMGTQLKQTLSQPVNKFINWQTELQQRMWHRFSRMWNLPILVMGFLLGRAMILESVSPFAIAYLAVILHLARKQSGMVMLILIAGAATHGGWHALEMAGYLVVIITVQRIWKWVGRGQLNYAPFMVAISSSVGHVLLLEWRGFTPYQGILAAIDVTLSVILTFIFVHSLPLFTVKRKRFSLRHEEIVCLVILIGSVLTGTMDWSIGPLSIVHIFSRFLILLLALVGGSMLGSSMGVVTGLILSLSDTKAILQISLLAFAGLLAGLFKEGKRIGVSLGFMIGSAILTFYDGGTTAMWLSLQESLLAVVLFLLVPKSLVQVVSRYVPGTAENQLAHQDYIRRLRDVTAAKVEQFTELFQELSFSFREETSRQRKEDEEQMNLFVGEVVNQMCVGCGRYEVCWEQNVMRTYQGMTDLMTWIEVNRGEESLAVPEAWQNQCVRSERVMNGLQEQYAVYEHDLFWKNKIKDSRRLVSDQLAGMAEVMGKLSTDIRHETQVLSAHEEKIHESLEEIGLAIQRVDVINLEEGKVEIEVVMPHRDGLDECKKLIAPMLTEILGEPIAVFRKVVKDGSSGAVITLGSAQQFELKTGAATVAKGGSYLSGDSYAYMNLGTGKYAVALSDGMGNGQRAQSESSAALKLMRRLLQSGMNEERTVDIVNSILSLRSTDEMFATIDLAMVDLNTAQSRFMKIGSTPSFIKRGRQVVMVSSANPPIGILNELHIEPIEMELKSDDLIVMVTDGIYDAPFHVEEKDAFITKLITEIETKDPQGFADALLKKVVHHLDGYVGDDMTVVVSKVERYAPEWSTIRLPNTHHIQRKERAKAFV